MNLAPPSEEVSGQFYQIGVRGGGEEDPVILTHIFQDLLLPVKRILFIVVMGWHQGYVGPPPN